ncbi:hypothetical protein CapIbe_022629 [Capra ibex]
MCSLLTGGPALLFIFSPESWDLRGGSQWSRCAPARPQARSLDWTEYSVSRLPRMKRERWRWDTIAMPSRGFLKAVSLASWLRKVL